MQFKALAFSAPQDVHWGSDIKSLKSDGPRLVVVIARERLLEDFVRGLKVSFSDATAFRYLDEVDLAVYWLSDGFPFGHHVLEVLQGGWLDEESQLRGYSNLRREWLLVTGNGSVSVFARTRPEIEDVVYPLGV